MEQYLVAWDGHMAFDDGENAEDVLDRVMEYLLETNLVDPTIAFDAGTGKITFEAIAQADDVLGAVENAAGAFRSSLHTAGVDTRDWRQPEPGMIVFDQKPTSVKHLVGA